MASLACFVSAHGFGHAARSAAVLEALTRRSPELEIDLFTTVPSWFFEQSLSFGFRYHCLQTDVGMVQRSSLEEDPGATLTALDELFPPAAAELEVLARDLAARDCRLVLADISPLGLALAAAAGIPSVLLENFTWDWIYTAYLDREPRLARHLGWLEETFSSADLHLQAEPCCRPALGAARLPPVSRSPRRPAPEIRQALGIAPDERLVLVTMGGIAWSYASFPVSPAEPGLVYVVPGGGERLERRDGLVLLPHHSEFHHPDLVAAADLLIGKLGYSTVAEAYWGGVGIAYLRRPDFAESEVLERFVRRHLAASRLPAADFVAGRWPRQVEPLPNTRGGPREGVNGAEIAAERIEALLNGEIPRTGDTEP